MTRYSRSVIPGRPADDPHANPNLDRMVFGAKRRPAAAPAHEDEPDFLPPIDDDESDRLVSRATSDRRSGDRRSGSPGRRASEYTPLREDGRAARIDDSRRGPLLLAGALMIVAVFGVVVWTAYSDGVATDEAEVTPELSTAGAFKTPPRMVEAAPVIAEPVDEIMEEGLDGAATDSLHETRPAAPARIEAEPAPPPSKVMAPPPAPLKAPPQQAAVAPPPTKVEPPRPVAAAPAPAPAPAMVSGAFRPAFAATGDHVVQIAATSSAAAVDSEWTRLSKSMPELLSGAERFVQVADVNGKTVYRLRVGSFASKADAAAFCTVFKARGGNCYPAVK